MRATSTASARCWRGATSWGSGRAGAGAENIAKLFATTRRFPDHGNTHAHQASGARTRSSNVDGATAASRSTFCVVQNTEAVALLADRRRAVLRYLRPRLDAGWYFTERRVDVQMVGDVSDRLVVDPSRSF